MEVEKNEQEKMSTKMAKKLNIRRLNDDLDTEEDQGGEEREGEQGQAAKGIKDIKGFDQKSAPKPDKYGGEIREFQTWQDLFTALLAAHDPQWTMILKDIEKMDEEIIKKEQERKLREEWGISKDATWKKIQNFLYLNLLQYTSGDPNTKVKGGGVDGVMESYRHLTHKGKNATLRALMDRRIKFMNPIPAKNISEIEDKMTMWKTDIRYIVELGMSHDQKMIDDPNQMITILISMMPDIVADHLITKYDKKCPNYDEMEAHLYDFLSKVEMKDRDKKGGSIKSVEKERLSARGRTMVKTL
jgi:hypothetical protein